MWFWSRVLGPGPSSGTGNTGLNGFAGPTSRIAKNATTQSIVIVAKGSRFPGRFRWIHATAAAYSASTQAQKRIDPSSAPQSEMIVNRSGVERLPTFATYETEKSCVTSATIIAIVATVTRKKFA